jgi:NAD/NADP transhydrogenase alpha subunit
VQIFYSHRGDIISNSDAILPLKGPNDENLNKKNKDQILKGVLNPFIKEKKLKEITSKNINSFTLELLPRRTRAQSMDIRSAEAKLAG